MSQLLTKNLGVVPHINREGGMKQECPDLLGLGMVGPQIHYLLAELWGPFVFFLLVIFQFHTQHGSLLGRISHPH